MRVENINQVYQAEKKIKPHCYTRIRLQNKAQVQCDRKLLMNDLRLSCVKASKKLIVLVVNMEMTSPIWLRPKALVKPLRLLKHCFISTAVPQSPSPCAEVCFKQLQKNMNTSDCCWKFHCEAGWGSWHQHP